MWRKRAHKLAPYKNLCSTKVRFKWTDVEKNIFVSMKNIVGSDVLLSYPNFSKTFIIHTDASNTQLGGDFSQNGKLVAFYSRKLTPAQIYYTTTKKNCEV